jgi:hypothetical protein
LKKLRLYDPVYFSESQEEPSKVPKTSRSATKKDSQKRKMEEEEIKMTQKMSKIDINKD